MDDHTIYRRVDRGKPSSQIKGIESDFFQQENDQYFPGNYMSASLVGRICNPERWNADSFLPLAGKQGFSSDLALTMYGYFLIRSKRENFGSLLILTTDSRSAGITFGHLFDLTKNKLGISIIYL